MTISVIPKIDKKSLSFLGSGGLRSQIEKTGRMPPVSVIITPLQPNTFDILRKPLQTGSGIVIDRFISYSFSSSILIPVDVFSFDFVAPDGPPLDDTIKDGDLITLQANGIPLVNGVIDTTEVETDSEFGEKGTIQGRDLMGMLEDQDAISLDSKPLYASAISIENGVRLLLKDTRISRIDLRNAPFSNYLLSTEPGESKLSSLQRFLEPVNCVSWMSPNGSIVVGKPNFSQNKSGNLVLNREKRFSNVLSMRATRSATSIPNVIVPIWSGQELVTDRTPVQQRLENAASGPSRLLKLGHRVPKSVVVSAPNAVDAQGLAGVNTLKAGGGNILQAYAKREIARQNVNELIVQVSVPGHFNENGDPYRIDTIYYVEYDRGRVSENMYLFQVDYQLTEDQGQRTNLYFCRLGTIVSDVVAP